jgi:hypothetical protein
MMSLVDTLTLLLTEHKVIPDIILDPSFSPSVLISIQWPNGTKANLGNTLTINDTLDEPKLLFTPLSVPDNAGLIVSDSEIAEITYTLVLIDPDAPSNADPKYRQFRHWVVRPGSR